MGFNLESYTQLLPWVPLPSRLITRLSLKIEAGVRFPSAVQEPVASAGALSLTSGPTRVKGR